MTTTLNLNAVHSELLTQVLKLTRYQQSHRLKSIDHCFKTSLSRLRDDEVYTGDEVESIITALQDTVRSEVQTELRDASHSNGLLLQQLLEYAEQWHLTLAVEISELENREKLDMIKDFEEGKPQEKMSITVTQGKQMIPVEDMNVASSWKIEIQKLQDEKVLLEKKLEETDQRNQILTEDMHRHQQRTTETILTLGQNLDLAQQEISRLMTSMSSEERHMSRNLELESVQNEIKQMSVELDLSRGLAEAEAEKLRTDLELREDKLRKVQSALLLTEKELEKKFQATGAYANMKKILMQKNNTIKSLRLKLAEAGGMQDVVDETPSYDDE